MQMNTVMIASMIAAVDQKEDTSELREKRIELVKTTMKKIIWYKYHKGIKWDIGEWQNDCQAPLVKVCDIIAKIEV